MRTPSEYLGAQATDWLQRNAGMEGCVPAPWVFEGAIGGFVHAGGRWPVAYAAEKACAMSGCDFAVMPGDNIYPDGATLGADGISDARRFEDMLDEYRPALRQPGCRQAEFLYLCRAWQS